MEELQVNPIDLNDHNLESEKSVLGAILNDGVNTKVIGILDITDFYLDSHQYIYRAIQYLHKNKQPIDLVLVSDVLQKNEKLDDIGGSYYLSELMMDSVTSHLLHHAKLIKQYSVVRQAKEKLLTYIKNGHFTSLNEVKDTIDLLIKKSPTDEASIVLNDVSDYIEDKSPEPDMIIENGILPERGLLILGGQPKAGKSLMSLNMATCIANGTKWLDFEIKKPRKTLVLQAENSYHNMRRRVKAMVQTTPRNKTLTISDPVSLKINEHTDYHKIEELIKEHEIDVLIIDPLVYFHSMNENDNAEMGLVMEQFRSLANNLNIAIIIVHHAKKVGMSDMVGGGNLRGASSVFGAVDSSILLSREVEQETDEVAYTIDFDLRNGENPERLYLHLDQQTLQMGLTTGHLPDLGSWIVNFLNRCENKGADQTFIISEAEKQGFKSATIKRKINKLIEEELVKSDNKQRNRRLWYKQHYNDLPF